ncbi:hypothetical protein ACQE3E_16390 [Methylomonas sp. MED-D]|uniref:hypothetical protein n=1 Tax=unclassified Methylomonas TaxID=2608980 RepID=UPI0028A4C5E9|nr:hypothetical protein [Methylomonas sp. MV1]MDT4331063.1 hypothetical protein [Methylomonas sp. MV1]
MPITLLKALNLAKDLDDLGNSSPGSCYYSTSSFDESEAFKSAGVRIQIGSDLHSARSEQLVLDVTQMPGIEPSQTSLKF